MYILLVVIGLIIIAIVCGAVITAVKKKALNDCIETEKKAELSLVDIVSYLKRPEVLQELQSSKDLVAVALKEKKDDGTHSVMVCIWDQKTSTVKQSLKRFVADQISEDLRSIFGNKDMIVLK